MSLATIKIVFRKDKIRKNGKAPINVRITKDRKITYVATGISLEERFWDFDRSIVKKSHPNSARMNNLLKKLEFEYTDGILKYQTEDLKISVKQLKRAIMGVEAVSFFRVAEEIINRYRMAKQVGTQHKSISILNKLKEFLKSENLTFQEMTVRFITEYENYLIGELKNKRNTINKDLKFIKHVFNYAVQQELIHENINPFNRIIMHSEETNRGFLSPAEIGLLEGYNGNDLEMKCLTTCLFQYHSGGLRISDVLLLRKENLENGRLQINIKKTGKQMDHILRDEAKTILEGNIWNDEESGIIFNFIPKGKVWDDTVEGIDSYISSTTALINKYLKKIGKSLGIKKNISTHIFRHSFATNALAGGMRVEHLQGVLRHANIRETQNYGKVQSREIDTALKQLNFEKWG